MDEELPNRTGVVVIGGGPAGYAAAIRLGQRGRDVVLIERDAVGGTCLNHGCIPSKAFIAATEVADRAGDAERMGIHADPAIDLAAMTRWKDRIVTRLTKGVEHLCRRNGVTLVEGTATFVDDERLSVEGPAGTAELAFEAAVIATGSTPIELPPVPFDEPGVLDARAALALEEIPGSLAVVGAGYIGMELATVFAKLGSEVTVVELLDRALARYDEELVAPVMDRADDLGITFHFETEVVDHRRIGDDDHELELDGIDAPDTVAADRVLVAVGRRPATNTVDLATVGLEPNDDGAIAADPTGRTGVPRIYAVGDVTGEPMLAHAGIAEGEAAAAAIAGESSPATAAVPEVVFTDPEIARVGMTASGAAAAGHVPTTARVPFRANGRALTLDRREGFVELVADEDTGRVLGGAIVGPHAGELIAEVGLAVETGATLADVAGTIHAHPTLSEAVGEAAALGLGEAIHVLNP